MEKRKRRKIKKGDFVILVIYAGVCIATIGTVANAVSLHKIEEQVLFSQVKVYSLSEKINQQQQLIDVQSKIISSLQQQNNKIQENVENVSATYEQISRGDFKRVPPGDTSTKTYMPHSAITSRGSRQYELKQLAYTDNNGLRKIGNDFLIAMGTYYGSVGDRFIITLDSGKTFTAMMGDVKSDAHTDALNMQCVADGSVIEFIVDKDKLNPMCKGDISVLGFEGNIKSIKKLN